MTKNKTPKELDIISEEEVLEEVNVSVSQFMLNGKIYRAKLEKEINRFYFIIDSKMNEDLIKTIYGFEKKVK